jgi:hypothetical protein
MTDVSSVLSEMEEDSRDKECCICYENIGEKNNCVTECGHKFCFKCLATAMTRSNACPCCRRPLIDLPDEDEDYGGEVVEDEDNEDDVDDDEEDEEDHYDNVTIETFVERIEKAGFTMLDMVSMHLGHFSKTDEKYTIDFTDDMYQRFNLVIDAAIKEARETALFASEDHSA